MSIKFIADGMLGTLAKWLRILGYDTLFDPGLDDSQLVRLARAEDRVLLTRDRELTRRRGVRTLLVCSGTLDEQIRQILSEYGPQPERSLSRCPVCNGLLQEMDPEVARAQVPPYVAQTQRQFRTCPNCRRIYWRGTHWQRMDERLAVLHPQGPPQHREGDDQPKKET